MNPKPAENWETQNQQYLSHEVRRVKQRLEALQSPDTSPGDEQEDPSGEGDLLFTLSVLCKSFGLSPFERDILLMCAGVELESDFAKLVRSMTGDQPTFSMALATLAGGHWSAISPAGPLRHWRLIEVQSGRTLSESPLRIDERVLHYLTGLSYLDERLQPFIRPVAVDRELTPCQSEMADRIETAWSLFTGATTLPVVCLSGGDQVAKRAVVAEACTRLNCRLLVLNAATLPVNAVEMESLLRLWNREALLNACALMIEDHQRPSSLTVEKAAAVVHWAERCGSPLVVAVEAGQMALDPPVVALELPKPTAADQLTLWKQALNVSELSGSLKLLPHQFSLSATTIRAAAADALERAQTGEELDVAAWNTSRQRARPAIEHLASRVHSDATWDDLILPAPQKELLRNIVSHLRHRGTVYEDWGFAAKLSRGLGMIAMFTGQSGTGKTLAAEVLANEMHLDCYRIDLSRVISKYIGETEKNLAQVFDAAEGSGAILLFDEADAIFGKRTEVKDSHDRYANVEVSYLLQRLEAYNGLAILTTNKKTAIDSAFLRRIRFIVEFPFPDSMQREEIWRRSFPAAAPARGLDRGRLAKLNVSGGSIRNIALNAAFHAAEAGEPLTMHHVLRSARSEYRKLERPWTEGDL